MRNLDRNEVRNEALLDLENEADGDSKIGGSQASLPVEVLTSVKRPAAGRHIVPLITQQPIDQRLRAVGTLFGHFRNLNGDSDENRKWVASAMNYLRDFSHTFEELVV